MKKILKLLIVLSLIVLTSCGKQVTEEEAREALYNNLIERYGEEFEIGYMQFRSSEDEMWYQAKIYPTKYKGTPRGKDEYYKSHGNVNIEKGIFGEKIGYVGDLYRVVLFNESANEFYLPKLKELFGENVLPVLEIDSSRVSKNPEFLSNPKFLPEYKKRLEDGSLPFLKGGIYIFGRVESDKDREWYRKQIYEFVQFMKQTGTFEYVDLDIIISDERVLTKGYEEVAKKLVYNDKNMTEWRKRRKEEMKSLDSEFAKMTQKELNNKLNSINKSEYLQKSSGGLLYVKLYSPKYITSQNLDDEEIKNYDKLEDINFRWEVW